MSIAPNREFVTYIKGQEYDYKMKAQGRFC